MKFVRSYLAGARRSILAVGMYLGALVFIFATPQAALAQNQAWNDENFLALPAPGSYQLRILSGNVLEVMMITAKDPDPAPLTTWNFLDANGVGTLPPASSFTVSANGQNIPVSGVGFKRRLAYAPLRTRDMRVGNWLYLQLGSTIPANAVVTVLNPAGNLWGSSVNYVATNSALRFSPAVHVNQAGYVVNFTKKALVGFYLGNIGELPIPTGAGFQLVNAANGSVAYTGTLSRRRDVGYYYTPTPYQEVFEADFTSFNTPGEYKVVVPGLGASFPFFIDEGMAATYARTYALGIYHQRCGTDNVFPYTRHTHGPCHTNLVMVPSSPGPEQDFVNRIVDGESAGAVNNPRHTAPRLTSVGASLYPFVNTASFDARGGHHDAGDYSKYTTSVSLFIHNLIFSVDALPGVKDLDNLGIPESGDGISDIMQEAKWEADYLAKLQDADGGFYFIVYPRARQYELDVLPDQGDLQLVLPKNTSASAAAVGALADMASSPTFKATYPTVASNYLAKAVKGWQFLQNAIARYGKDGAYQMVTFSSDTFMHDDELAWAAAALYNATGDPVYQTALRNYMPNPNSPSLRRWDWWSMFGGWGCATRDYGFAARSGKLSSTQLDASYLALCEAEIKFAGSNSVDWSAKMAYGSSFTDESKGIRVAGWYFSGEWTLDPAAAWVIDSSAATKALYIDCILKNFNYEMGCNPVNVTYLTGLGTRRQREIVHQYALNDYRVLPPTGIPLGNIQAQYDYLQLYKTELSAISYPLDDSQGQPYAYYDRWADTFNVSTEFVVSQTAKTLPAAAMLMAMTPTKTQPWRSSTPAVVNLPATAPASQQMTPTLVAPGISAADLSKARIVWEAREQDPFIGPSYSFTPKHAGVQWVEAEAQLPDGRRLFALTNYTAIMEVANTIDLYQNVPLVQNTNVVAWYKLDGNLSDAKGREAALTKVGAAFIDTNSFSWAGNPSGAALRIPDLNDGVTVSIPNADLSSASSTSLSLEAMFYINRQVAFGRGNADQFVLSKSWNSEFALRHNIWTEGPAITGGSTTLLNNVALAPYLKLGQWQHLKIRLDRTGYTVTIDGQAAATVASADLANWGGGNNATLKIGGFDGWVDEIVIKNDGGGTVVTNPPPPTGNNAVVSVTATANAAESGLQGVFQVARTTTATTNLTVNLTYGGTATSGTDYSALPASVTIAAGSTTAFVTVTPIQDAVFEGNETITASITANANYSIGTQTATMTLTDDDPDSRPPPPGQTNYVTSPLSVDTNIVALYHLDGNLADASGRFANLTLGGLAVADASNLNWMNSPSGSALRVYDLGDKATVTLNNATLYTAGTTASLGVEAYVFVNSFMAYTHKPATIFKLAKRWDAQMIYNQDTWQQTPEVWGGIAKMIDVPAIAPYLQTNCWQKIGIFLDETGYLVKVNDVEVARSSSTDITKWAGAGNVDVEIGSFDGWIDEIAVRNNVKGVTAPPTKSDQTITFNSIPAKTYGGATFTLGATASSGLAVSYSSGNTSVATISGNTVTIVGAGTAVITANQAGNASYNAAPAATQTLTVNKAAATVTLGSLSATFDGTAKQASVTTIPSGLAVSMTYNGGATLPLDVGAYAVVATVNDANYTGSASGSLVIALPTNLPQTITFGAIAAKTYGGAAFALNATASSGLPVSYSSGNPSVATVSGNTVTIVGAGTATITASQAGNATYNPAASIPQALTVNKATATVTLGGLSATYDGGAKQATVTTSPSGLSVTATYNGSATLPVNAGSYAVVMTVNDANYSGTGNGTLVISPASQTITFGAIAAKTFGGAAFALNATASSGLAVTYSSGNTSVATISGNTVTIVGAGTAVITANQAGNANYPAATPVSQTLTVNKATATVTLSGLNQSYDGSAKQAGVSTTPSGLPVDVTYNGSATLPVNAGSYAVVATINHNNYTGTASGTLVVGQPSQTITFGPLPGKTYGDAGFALNATASSGLPVSYTSGNPSVATVSGSTVTIVGAGSAVITANQPGNANFGAAASVSQTLTVAKASATVTLSGLSATYDGGAKQATVTTSPSGLNVTATYNGSATLPVNAGSYAVLMTVNDANYSGTGNGTLVVSPASQTITFGGLVGKTFGDAAFALSASASSGLSVTYSSGNPSVATVSGNTVTIVGAGTAVITAAQAGNGNYSAASSVPQTLTVSKANATITLGSLAATYDGTAKSVTATTTPTGLPTTITYNGGSTAPANVGSYSVAVTINHSNYTGSANGTLVIGQANQSITFGALAAKTFGGAAFALNATASSGLPVSYSSDNASVATVSGNTVAILGAGTAVITANQAGNSNYPAATPVSQTLTVNKATATVTLSGLSQSYDGSAKQAGVSTTPSGLPVDVTYNGSTTLPVNAGSYAVVATVNNANYSGTASGTLVVGQPSQTITFGALPGKTYGDAGFALNATASSGLPVSFTSGNPSVATVSGSTVTIVGAGSAVITANQPGNANFGAAASVSQTLTVAKASATVALSGLSATYDGAAKTATASTTPSGLSVTITYNGSSAAPVNAGSYAVVATINNANYTGSANGTLVIAQPNQTITFGGLPTKTFGDAAFALNATASSGLPVTYSSGNTAVATVSGSTVTIVGAGTAVITASQAGNVNYAAATPVTQTLTVNKANATVTLSGLTSTYNGSAKQATVTTTPAGLSVTVTYDGGAAQPVNAGSYAVVATINHNNYTGSTNGTLLITQPTQTITFGALAAKVFGATPFALNATASSGLPVSYSSDNASVATVSGNTVTILGAGTAVITAAQAGNSNYAAATPVTQSLTVNKATATVALSGLTPTFDGSAKSAVVTTAPAGLPTTVTYNGSSTAPTSVGSYAVAATINHENYTGSANGTLVIGKATAVVTLGNLAHDYDGTPKAASVTTTPSGLTANVTYNGSATAPSAVGSYAVLATVNDTSYAGSANGTLLIVQPTNQTQTITFSPLSGKTFGDSVFTLSATSSSGLSVSFASGNPSVATVSGSTVTIVGAGTAVITASQNGNTIYNPATPVTQTLTVSKANATVALSGLNATYNGSAKPVTATTTPSGLPVTVTYDGASTAPANVGSYAVAATINHNNYTGSANGTLNIAQANQTITFGALAAKTIGNPAFALNATASSGLAVTYASANPNVATVSGNTVTIVGSGTTVITATQTGDANYAAATPVAQTLTVNKGSATVTLAGLNTTYDGTPKTVTATTVPAGLTTTITYNGTAIAPTNVGNFAVVATVTDSNYTGSANGTLVVAKASAVVSLSGLSATYDGNPKSVTATTTPVGLTVNVTYNGTATAPSAAGSYAVVATVSDLSYSGSASGSLVIVQPTNQSQTITFGALAAKTFGNPAFAVSATASSGLTVSFASDNPSVATVSGSTVTIVGAGTAVITASQNGNTIYNPAAPVAQVLTVTKASATVTLAGLNAAYNGSAKSVTATTTPSSLPVTVTYDGASTAPANVGSYAVTATINHNNYTGSANGTLNIAQANQTLTFGALAAKTVGAAAFTLNATASSSLTVTYASGNPSVATVSGNTVTIVGAGTTVITASQAGNANYAAATPVSQTLTVNKGSATVTLGGLAATYDGTAKSATATTTPAGLNTTITYNGSSTAPSSVGNYAVVATISDSNYAGSANGTLVIGKGSAVVTLNNLSATFDGSPKPVSASTTPSGLTVNVTYNGNASAPSAAGSYAVLATVNDTSYSGTANGTLVIVQPTNQTQTITFGPLPVKTFGNPAFALSASASSGLAVSFSSDNTSVATVSGNTVTIVGAGTAVITATQNGDSIYNPAAPVSQALTVNKASATITLAGLTATYNGSAKPASVTTTPASLPVDLTYNGSATAPVNAGTYSVSAAINHNNYTGTASGALTINKANATVTLNGLSAVYDGSPKSATVTTTPSGLATSVTYSGSSAAPAETGSYAVSATVTDPNYSGSANGTLTIVDAPSFVALTIVKEGQGTVTPNLDGELLLQGTNVTLSAQAASGWRFAGWSLNGNISSNASLPLNLQVSTTVTALFGDATSPTVNITGVVTNTGRGTGAGTITMLGTASDNTGVQMVEYAVVTAGKASGFQPATGSTNWTIDLPQFTSGNNSVRIRARDLQGNVSPEVVRNFDTTSTKKGNRKLSIAIVGEGSVTPNLNGQPLEMGKTYSLLARPAKNRTFSKWSGTVNSTNQMLQFVATEDMALTAYFAESNAPIVMIVSPAVGMQVTNAAALFRGTALDDSPIDHVEYSLNDGEYQRAAGTANWAANVTLRPGTNIFRARAFDAFGNVSTVASRLLFYSIVSPLTLWVIGEGSVSGATNGQFLEVGRSYRIGAVPENDHMFTEWSGGLQASTAGLTFVMQPDLLLQARFVTNPFVALKGTYHGLFLEEDSVRHEHSGSVKLTVSGTGTYTVSVKVGAKSFGLSGKFDWRGQASHSLNYGVGNVLALNLQLDTTNLTDHIEGSLSGSGWTSAISGYRAPIYNNTNLPPASGAFTFVIPNAGNTTQPAGHGIGTMKVDDSGLATISGRLGDGTPFTSAATVSRNGELPVYSQVYALNNGSVLSWLQFTNSESSDFNGVMSWIKPPSAANTRYAAGFAISVECFGSAYTPTNGLLNFSNGFVTFTGGEMGYGFANEVRLSTSGKVVNLSTNALWFSAESPSGLFSGWAVNPATGKSSTYSGVAFQKLNTGYGHAFGKLQTSAVRLSETP